MNKETAKLILMTIRSSKSLVILLNENVVTSQLGDIVSMCSVQSKIHLTVAWSCWFHCCDLFFSFLVEAVNKIQTEHSFDNISPCRYTIPLGLWRNTRLGKRTVCLRPLFPRQNPNFKSFLEGRNRRRRTNNALNPEVTSGRRNRTRATMVFCPPFPNMLAPLSSPANPAITITAFIWLLTTYHVQHFPKSLKFSILVNGVFTRTGAFSCGDGKCIQRAEGARSSTVLLV